MYSALPDAIYGAESDDAADWAGRGARGGCGFNARVDRVAIPPILWNVAPRRIPTGRRWNTGTPVFSVERRGNRLLPIIHYSQFFARSQENSNEAYYLGGGFACACRRANYLDPGPLALF